MTKDNKNILKHEQEIPKDVMEKLIQNREKILNNNIKQDKKTRKIHYKKVLISTLAIASAFILIALINPQMNAAVKQALGISQDPGVAIVQNNGIENELNLTSTQNGRDITLTTFVSTKKKFAFDYRFKLDDEKLKELLKKQQNPERKFTKLAPNSQDIDIGLFVEGETEDIRGGGSYSSTFRVEGDMFYGSVVATLDNEDIPADATLVLHIYKLFWVDAEELDQAFLEASETNNPFGVDSALVYEGDWRFDIAYKPLTQTSETQISNVANITDIKVSNDALHTTIRFIAPLTQYDSIGIDLYKDGVAVQDQLSMETYDLETGEVTTSFSLSALDKTSVYTVQVNKVDYTNGETIETIGSFDIQNK